MDFIKELLRDNRFVHIPQNFIRKFEPIEVLRRDLLKYSSESIRLL